MSLFKFPVKSTTRYGYIEVKYDNFPSQWEIRSFVITTYEDGSTKEFENCVATCDSEVEAIRKIQLLRGIGG